MLSPRYLPFFATLAVVLAISAAKAEEAGKLLPADTKVIVTFNLRQALLDHRKTEIVQRYLDQYRLALKGDEKELKKYYQWQELDKSEGISEQDFLARCKIIKSVSDALGIDPLEDLEQITFGYNGTAPGQAKEAGSFVLIVEGRFKPEKFKAAIERIAKENFGSFKISAAGDVWQVPNEPNGKFVSLVDARTLAITDGKKTMDEVLALARGKANAGLPKGMRTLLDGMRKEHAGIVVGDFDLLLMDVVRYLKEAISRAGDNNAAEKFIVGQAVTWIEKYANDIAVAGLGLSLREDDFRLQFAVDTKKPATAKELHSLMQTSSFWGAIALKTINTDLTHQLASILMRQRIVLKDTTLTNQVEVPYEFVKLLMKGPWLIILSKDFAPAGPASPQPLTTALSQAAFDELSTRVTSIRLWDVPAVDKTKPLPAGTFDVLQVPGVAYRDGPADPVRHKLDMYLPRNHKNFPVLVLVHGGAWVIGDNRSGGLYSSVGQFLASQGIGVVMPNYRLSPGVKHPEHIKDVARAVAWTRANIGKHGGDPQRLYVAGHSAGAHLAALLATDETYLRAEGLKTADVKGIIAISGIYKVPHGLMRFSLGGSGPRAMRIEQMLPARGDSDDSLKVQLPGIPAQLNIFIPVFGDTSRDCEQASPLTHVRRGLPPFLILYGENDLPTLAETAGEFHQALQREGCDVRLLKIAKRNHNSIVFSVVRPQDPTAQAIVDFIRK